jgi:hypothetical protein
MTAKKLTTKKATKTRGKRRKVDDGFVKMKRVGLHLNLSPSHARELLASVEPALKEARHSGGFSAAQVRLDARDLKSIYIYLGPWQMKELVARLKALTMEVAR